MLLIYNCRFSKTENALKVSPRNIYCEPPYCLSTFTLRSLQYTVGEGYYVQEAANISEHHY